MRRDPPPISHAAPIPGQTPPDPGATEGTAATAALPLGLTQWSTHPFRHYLTPVALVYARLYREPEPDWWGQRIGLAQAAFFDQACGQTSAHYTGRVVAGDELSRLWLYFAPEHGLAAAMALQEMIRQDRDLSRLGMQVRVGVALGEANAMVNPDALAPILPSSDQNSGRDSGWESGQHSDWNSGCYGVETAIRKAFRLCWVARAGEVLASSEFAELLPGSVYDCPEQRLAGFDDQAPLALVIAAKHAEKPPALAKDWRENTRLVA